MANQTENYKLTKPLASEFYDVEVQNGNMDKIDAALKENADGSPQNGGSHDADIKNRLWFFFHWNLLSMKFALVQYNNF